MRYILILCFFCSIVTVHPSLSQNKESDVTIRANRETLSQILQKLSKENNLLIAYDPKLANQIIINIDIVEKPLDEALTLLLANRGLNFKIRKRKILITKSREFKRQDSFNAITLSGKISDGQTGESLPYATLKINGTQKGTSANVNGNYVLHEVPDTSKITIEYLGYSPIEYAASDLAKNPEIKLYSQTQQLDEVIITSELEAMELKKDAGHIVFNPKQLTGLPNLGEVDVFRSLQLLPGISATNETSSGLVVRGGTPDQNLILFDGFSVFQVDHFFGVFSAFNHHAIKDIQVYKGGFDARYGGRTSSVIDITGKSGNAFETTGNLGVNLISVNGALEVPLGDKWTFLFAGRRAFTDIIRSNLYQNLVENVRNNESESPQNRLGFSSDDLEPEFYFYDINSKLTFRPTKKDVISASFFRGEDQLGLFAESLDEFLTLRIDDRLDWRNNGLSLNWSRQWNPEWFSQILVAYSDYEHSTSLSSSAFFDNGFDDDSFSFQSSIINNVNDFKLLANTEWSPTQKVTSVLGVSLERNETTLITQFEEDDFVEATTDLDQTGLLFSLFSQNYFLSSN